MPYIIDATVDNRGRKQTIDATFYSAIQDASSILTSHHTIEERFDIFLNNYTEYEVKVFQLLIQHTLQAKKIFDSADQTPTEIERCLANLLSSARGYREQISRPKLGRSDPEVKKILQDLEAQSIEYCVVEAWRNYSQHENLLVRGWSLLSNWTRDEAGKKKQRRHGFDPRISLASIKGYAKRDKSLQMKMERLASEDGDISIIPILRKYVEDLSHVHKAIRDLKAQELTSALSVLTSARQIGINLGAKPSANMFACHIDDDHSTIEQIYLGQRRSQSLDHLQSKNTVPLVNFSLVEFYT